MESLKWLVSIPVIVFEYIDHFIKFYGFIPVTDFMERNTCVISHDNHGFVSIFDV